MIFSNLNEFLNLLKLEFITKTYGLDSILFWFLNEQMEPGFVDYVDNKPGISSVDYYRASRINVRFQKFQPKKLVNSNFFSFNLRKFNIKTAWLIQGSNLCQKRQTLYYKNKGKKMFKKIAKKINQNVKWFYTSSHFTLTQDELKFWELYIVNIKKINSFEYKLFLKKIILIILSY